MSRPTTLIRALPRVLTGTRSSGPGRCEVERTPTTVLTRTRYAPNAKTAPSPTTCRSPPRRAASDGSTRPGQRSLGAEPSPVINPTMRDDMRSVGLFWCVQGRLAAPTQRPRRPRSSADRCLAVWRRTGPDVRANGLWVRGPRRSSTPRCGTTCGLLGRSVSDRGRLTASQGRRIKECVTLHRPEGDRRRVQRLAFVSFDVGKHCACVAG